MRAWKLTILLAMCLAICMGGCISSRAKVVIADHHDNAAEFNRRIQAAPTADAADAPLPGWVKVWAAADAEAWAAMEAWSTGKAATAATTQPTGGE